MPGPFRLLNRHSPLNKLPNRLTEIVLLALCLAGCQGPIPPTVTQRAAAEEPTRTPTALPTETPQSELRCASPRVGDIVPPDAYDWAVRALETIEPGTTKMDEVALLLGDPSQQGWNAWWYDFAPELSAGLGVNYNSNETVTILSLWYTMTLGQLIELYGNPSRVFRTGYLEDPEPRPLDTVLLFYDERFLLAEVNQGLCEFPPEVVVDVIDVFWPGTNFETRLTPDAVEVEWPGLMAD